MNGMLALLAVAGHQCVVVVTAERGLLASLFVTGLVGGLTHCMGMCGPFVLTQVTALLETIPAGSMSESHRLRGAALVPYHLGRLTTYALLGVVAAGLASVLEHVFWIKGLSAALLVLAAVLLIGYAWPALRLHPTKSVPWSGFIERLAQPLFRTPLGVQGYLLGVLLGFIPCGLLYGALAAAAATHDPLAGGFGMAAFALGTIPTLVVIGWAGHMAGNRFRPWLKQAAPILLGINAVVLLWMAITILV